jgi:hypothetical protein
MNVDAAVESAENREGAKTVISEDVVREEPALEFNSYALAFHFAVEWTDAYVPDAPGRVRGQTGGGTAGEPMESYERDLLLYAHRDKQPFRTRVVSVPADLATLTARFPPELVYESELRRIRLQCGIDGGTGRRRMFTVFASETIFARSRITILNLVLRPLASASEGSQLNEYDLIKLIKLWEGGEERPASSWAKEILFEPADGKPIPLEEAAARLFPGWLPGLDGKKTELRAWPGRQRHDPAQPATPLAYRVGTVDLKVPKTQYRQQLFHDIAALREGDDAPYKKTEAKRWDRVVAVDGVLQGLLDFRAISEDELADVFAEVDVDADDESLSGFHKGTLLSVSAEGGSDSHDERRSPIGVDPYLAIPNVVLLHNEQRLKAARQLELRLSAGQPRRSHLPSDSDRVRIDQTANGLDEMTGLLAQHLPNIFHYASERRLYETGGHSRGFDDLEKLIRLRREELMSTLQRRERRRDRWTAALAIVSAVVIGVVAAVQKLLVQQAIETIDWWIILMLAAFLYLVFFQLRNRLF